MSGHQLNFDFYMAIAIGFSFGIWQHSFAAGAFAGLSALTFSRIAWVLEYKEDKP